MDERERRLGIARARVDAFIREHPEYTVEGVAQPSQGVNNLVVFARKGGEQVVLKAFIWDGAKDREGYALHHWRNTGLVPRLLHDAASRELIVMSWIRGDYLGKGEGADAWRTTGRAAGQLSEVPVTGVQQAEFESRFYEKATLDGYLGRILSLGRSIHEKDRNFRDSFWQNNLDFMERELPSILAQPRALYHEDVANVFVENGKFSGFFDLEMSRIGCGAMQLGAALRDLIFRHDGDWPSFLKGWEEGAGAPLTEADKRAAVAASHFLAWRVITRYLSYDGTPGSGHAWAEPADPVKYRGSMEGIEGLVGIR